MDRIETLKIRHFAQIEEATLTFGDLTVLVGAQGTGKSLALQWLKIALDGRQIVGALTDAGHQTKDPDVLIDLIFGTGMRSGWRDETQIQLGRKQIKRDTIGRIGNGVERVFFIPAHRSMLISDGWAARFQKLTPETPVVARMFSDTLFKLFSSSETEPLFPKDRVLKKELRDKIDDAVYHGGTVAMEVDPQQHAQRLRLTHGNMSLPFMTWTAGQREFTPLLLGFYHLIPPRRILKQQDIEWVVIEEPEMGLHPQAVTVVLLLVLELLYRGYQVVLSTHSPHVLTAVWMIQRLKEFHADWRLLCRAFDLSHSQQFKKVAEASLEKAYRVHHLAFSHKGRVNAKDISKLDPGADDPQMAGWGGLTEFSSQFGDAVIDAVNSAPLKSS
ncbi:MAG: AAA family ATPase [Alphaproteobacteria bacterium]